MLTAFYQQETGLMSEPVRRARAYAYILEHKHIEIYPGELIVGEKGDTPKTAPTFPELCCHSLQDLDILNSREKTSFRVDPATRVVRRWSLPGDVEYANLNTLTFDRSTSGTIGLYK